MIENVVRVLNAWFSEEHGNRVTTNNMEALARRLIEVVTPKEAKDDEAN